MNNFREVMSKILIAVFFFGLAVGSSYVLASWQGPIASPPNGNVDAPINVGTSTQSKLGALLLGASSGTTTGGSLLDVRGSIVSRNLFTGTLLVASGTGPGTYTKGKVLVAVDDNGTAEWRDIGELVQSERKYLFGGMYGAGDTNVDNFTYNGNLFDTDEMKFTNPFAENEKKCPTGYNAVKNFGTISGVGRMIDNTITLCLGEVGKVDPVGSFGGMFSFVGSSGGKFTSYKNPFVDPNQEFVYTYGTSTVTVKGLGLGCPTGFTPRRVLGDSPITDDYSNGYPGDYSLFWCYSTATDNRLFRTDEDFKGMIWNYGKWGGSNYVGQLDRENPITGKITCGMNENTTQVYGNAWTDHGLYMCYPKNMMLPLP